MGLVLLSSFTIMILAVATATTHDPYPGAKTDYCYDQGLEGKLCFETLKMCEKMQSDDKLATGSCHKVSG